VPAKQLFIYAILPTMSTPHHPPPAIPQASFLGLPTELRLQIYSYLEDVTHYHVDNLAPMPAERSWNWNPNNNYSLRRRCRTPDPRYPFLCARPVFCGWYKTEDLCHSVPIPPEQELKRRRSGAAALRRTCKVIYEETKTAVPGDKEDGIGITVRAAYDARDMLKSMKPHELSLLVHFTIHYCPGEGHHHANGMNQIVHYLKHNHWDLANLRILAIQIPQPLRKFSTYRAGDQAVGGACRPGETWGTLWFLRVLAEAFEKRVQHVDIVLEAWIVIRGKHASNQNNGEDEMVRVRGTYCRDAPHPIAGERVCAIHTSKTMEFEIERRGVVKEGGQWEGERTWRYWVGPKWMRFWKAWGMGYAKSYRNTNLM
jgi:hypothetical protein